MHCVVLRCILLVTSGHINTTHTIMKNSTDSLNTIANEYKAQITELIEQESFRAMVIDIAQKMGVSADDWNNDIEFKTSMLAYFAGKYIQMQEAHEAGQEFTF